LERQQAFQGDGPFIPLRQGYSVFGETKTLKYGELKLKKEF
jgi:hypothetical protein